MIRKIKNLKDLHSEKRRLKLQLDEAEETLKQDMHWVKEELKPIRNAGKLFSNAFFNKNHSLLDDGVRITIDALLRNIILSKTGVLTRLIVPFLVKNLSSNFLLEKRPEIFGIIKGLIQKARKATRHNHGHYDKSTVDEMDY